MGHTKASRLRQRSASFSRIVVMKISASRMIAAFAFANLQLVTRVGPFLLHETWSSGQMEQLKR